MITDYPKANELPVSLTPDRTMADAIYSAWIQSADTPTSMRVSIPYSALTPEQRREHNRAREAKKG